MKYVLDTMKKLKLRFEFADKKDYMQRRRAGKLGTEQRILFFRFFML